MRDGGAGAHSLSALIMLSPYTDQIDYQVTRNAPPARSGNAAIAPAVSDVVFSDSMFSGSESESRRSRVSDAAASRKRYRSGSDSGHGTDASRPVSPLPAPSSPVLSMQIARSAFYLKQAQDFDARQQAIIAGVTEHLSQREWTRVSAHQIGALWAADLPNWTGTGGGRGAWRLMSSMEGNKITYERVVNYHDGKMKNY